MGKEIERKFLTKSDTYKSASCSAYIHQGYICAEKERVVRVRIHDNRAYLTIKNAAIGYSRDEYEYEIPLSDAQEMLHKVCCQPTIEKRRYYYAYEGFTWEVDEFLGENQGLVIAEIELNDEATQFPLPDFVAQEVTGDERYYNANLFSHPYKKW